VGTPSPRVPSLSPVSTFPQAASDVILWPPNRKRGDTDLMRFRATLTSLLAVVILSLSSVASACDVNCDRSLSRSRCPDAQGGNQQTASMAAMRSPHACCEGPINSSALSCRQQPVASQPALLFDPVDVAVQPNGNTAAVIPVPSLVVALALNASSPLRGPPRFRPCSPVFFLTPLRV
jgi:hypothetical protein